MVGFSGQYGLAARAVLAKIASLDWIRIADPNAGVADDFQFQAGGARYAMQVKWAQYPGSFGWAELVNGSNGTAPLLGRLAEAWLRVSRDWSGPLEIRLWSNEYPSTAAPRAGSVLASCSVARPNHFAAFLARSWTPIRHSLRASGRDWAQVAARLEVSEWQPAWDALRVASGLGEDSFARFVSDLDLHFGPVVDDRLLRPDEAPHEADLEHLAATLQALVADPARPLELSRRALLERLGWEDRLRFRNPHAFPVPAVYAANEAARRHLQVRLAELDGGYLALVGPAGSGKSTLLASLTWPERRIVRYYAFVPDSSDPLSGRGEAESFFHDVSLALEDVGIPRRGYGNDLRSQRSVLHAQLILAGERWRDSGETTVIVVDGLDHVPREQSPSRSLLEELPPPAALPAGVFVVLGTQTTSILPPPIAEALDLDHRVIELPPLAPAEILRIADAAGPGTWLLPGQRDELVTASEGHPLALSYLLQDLTALETSEPDPELRRVAAHAVLSDASTYGREVATRYRGYLRAVGDDPDLRGLLASVARLRAPVDLDWLKSWTPPPVLDQFVRRTATFFRREGTTWRFIHNSFRRFLVEESAEVAGVFDANRDRALHVALADICGQTNDRWVLYRDEELAHRYLAGDYARVIELATPTKLREKLFALRPLVVVKDQARIALRAAADSGDLQAFVRMLLFHNELFQRDLMLSAETIAEVIVDLEPLRALEHVVAAGHLRVPVEAALRVAARLSRLGSFQGSADIISACGGLREVARKHPKSAADWAEAVLHMSGLSEVLAQLDAQLAPMGETLDRDVGAHAADGDEAWAAERRRREREDASRQIATARNFLLARCFDLVLEVRDESSLELLLARIDREPGVGWHARARVARAVAASEDGDTDSVVAWSRAVIDLGVEAAEPEYDEEEEGDPSGSPLQRIPLSLRLRAADAIFSSGMVDAAEVDLLVPPGTRAAWPSILVGEDGLAPFTSFIDLARLRVVRPEHGIRPSGPAASDHPNRRSAGTERFKRALRELASLEGRHLLSSVGRGDAPNIAAEAAQVIRVLEVPARQTRDWTSWYQVTNAAPSLFRRLARLAATGGPASTIALLERFAAGWEDPNRAAYWSPSRQLHVLRGVLRASLPSAPTEVLQAVGVHLDRLGTAIAELDAGPQELGEIWLELSRAWIEAREPIRAEAALRRAVQTSWGPGLHGDDRQMRDWLDWLNAALQAGTIERGEFLSAARRYAKRLVAAKDADHDAAEAAALLIRMVWAVDPGFSTLLAEALCDHGIVAESDAVEAVLLGAAQDSRISDELTAITAAQLLIPLRRQPPDELRALIEQQRGASGSRALEVIDAAIDLWAAPEDTDASAADSAETITPNRATPPSGPQPSAPPASVTALLVEMRRDTNGGANPHDWRSSVEVLTRDRVTPAVGQTLLAEASRLHLDGEPLGWIADVAARSGLADEAASVLADALSRIPAYGWIRHYDGGSRLKLLVAALRNRHQTLVRLAARDLAGAVSTGAISSQIFPEDLRRIVEVIIGDHGVALAWPQVEEHLEVFAPAVGLLPELAGEVEPTDSPAEALLRWVAGYFGHPVRQRDFGARKVLQAALELARPEAEGVLIESLTDGGWLAEAALHVLLACDDALPPLSSGLTRSLAEAAVGIDAICRDLARKLCLRHGIRWNVPTYRRLPAVYRLALPDLRERTASPLDDRGVPMIDHNDPQQVVAPFDVPLRFAATAAGIDEESVLYHAAAIARAIETPWLRGGHQAQATRLTQRGELHAYRPWAFMAGRRALGIVLAELADARSLDADIAQAPAYALGLIDEVLTTVSPEPLDDTTPAPWHARSEFGFDARAWCAQTEGATEHYMAAAGTASTYVIAEATAWVRLEWEKPEERRTIKTSHGPSSAGGILLPRRARWESSYAPANDYLRGHGLLWSHQELIVEGWEIGTDPPWSRWLALHPAVARSLDWRPDPDQLFAWVGDDDVWRARSIVRARGQLSHQAYAHTYCAEGWQVVLSRSGLAEVREAFGPLRRVLQVERTLPARPRDERPIDETNRFSAPLAEPS